MKNDIDIGLIPYESNMSNPEFDLDRIIYDLNGQIDLLSSQADNLDYLVAVASGILCGMLDIFWVGEFSLERGREIASDKVEAFVKKAAKLTRCESDGNNGYLFNRWFWKAAVYEKEIIRKMTILNIPLEM